MSLNKALLRCMLCNRFVQINSTLHLSDQNPHGHISGITAVTSKAIFRSYQDEFHPIYDILLLPLFKKLSGYRRNYDYVNLYESEYCLLSAIPLIIVVGHTLQS